jgi:hypothetical protein
MYEIKTVEPVHSVTGEKPEKSFLVTRYRIDIVVPESVGGSQVPVDLRVEKREVDEQQQCQ